MSEFPAVVDPPANAHWEDTREAHGALSHPAAEPTDWVAVTPPLAKVNEVAVAVVDPPAGSTAAVPMAGTTTWRRTGAVPLEVTVVITPRAAAPVALARRTVSAPAVPGRQNSDAEVASPGATATPSAEGGSGAAVGGGTVTDTRPTPTRTAITATTAAVRPGTGRAAWRRAADPGVGAIVGGSGVLTAAHRLPRSTRRRGRSRAGRGPPDGDAPCPPAPTAAAAGGGRRARPPRAARPRR